MIYPEAGQIAGTPQLVTVCVVKKVVVPVPGRGEHKPLVLVAIMLRVAPLVVVALRAVAPIPVAPFPGLSGQPDATVGVSAQV